jgi:hypothetical protein
VKNFRLSLGEATYLVRVKVMFTLWGWTLCWMSSRKILMKSNNPEASLGKDKTYFEPAKQGMGGTKTNDECASLRMGDLPKAEAVRDAKCDDGAAVRCAKKQLQSDGASSGAPSVLPTKGTPAPTSGCK